MRKRLTGRRFHGARESLGRDVRAETEKSYQWEKYDLHFAKQPNG